MLGAMTRQSRPINASLRVLGIDPGTRVVGWAIVEGSTSRLKLVGCGAIRGPEGDYAARLAHIHTELARIAAESGCVEAAVEEIFAGRNMKTALVTGEGRGVALAALGAAGMAVSSFPSKVVKRAVTGNGSASKQQVARMVALQLGLGKPPSPADVTDACAVAITRICRPGYLPAL